MSLAKKATMPNGRRMHDGMIKSTGTRVGDWVIAIICFVLMLICIIPMLYVLANSLSSPEALVYNRVFLWPEGWNFDAYKTVLTGEKYLWSLGWTAILTVICTLLSITLTICASYPLIYTNLKGGKAISLFMIFTMYFSAGTIPGYLVLKGLNMLDTPYALILPNCISVFNVIIMRSFFFGVPDSLREAAEIDGAGPLRVLQKVYLPLSLPVIATLSLFYAVGRWNGFSDAQLYLSDKGKQFYPIQKLLYDLIQNSTNTSENLSAGDYNENGVSQTVQMATVIFATVPILLVYPWLQRYFVAGVTIGAVKG